MATRRRAEVSTYTQSDTVYFWRCDLCRETGPRYAESDMSTVNAGAAVHSKNCCTVTA